MRRFLLWWMECILISQVCWRLRADQDHPGESGPMVGVSSLLSAWAVLWDVRRGRARSARTGVPGHRPPTGTSGRPKAGLTMRLVASGLILQVGFPWEAVAQQTPAAVSQSAPAQPFNAEQLDALLASIALYPDELLTQLLMASTFPLEVVAAARWVDDPAHKSLTGDALAKAVEAQPWDPSVKSLV